MKFSIDKHEKYAVLTLEEETLDTRFAPNLKSELVLLNSTGFRNIILDIHQVNFADSSGLSSMLVGNRLCQGSNGTFVVARASDNVKKLIEISQLQDVLEMIPSMEEASDYIFIEEIQRELGAEGE
ncbi:MAG: anti-sigma factor antagonist [Flavobacteriia bacterium]|jgi:anti-sigma B factor antagonist|nr:anti-sigma factor antagonist [Flavobacteriia bacterium]